MGSVAIDTVVCIVVAWCHVICCVGSMKLIYVRLVPGWVTVCRQVNHLGM